MTDPVATALEQHAHSLRELARALVGSDDADDVVQATAVFALARPHLVRQPLAFLRHLLRAQAHRHHRGAARRRRREGARAAARDEVAPPAEHALEQREAVAQLHAAMMNVPQPHLGALLLRYFEDLSPPTIAERLAVPLPTIKSRLARGLELLRAELDRGTGRAQWQQRLATAFALPPAAFVRAGTVVPFVAWITMKLAAVCVLAVAATAWFLWPREDVVPSPLVAAAAAGASGADAAGATQPPDPAPAAARTEVAAVLPGTARLTGRVTSSDGTPLAGASISVLTPFDFDAAAIATGATDAAGAFTCDAPPGEHFVRIAAARHVGIYTDKRTLAAGTTSDLGTMAIDPGIVVRGCVVDRDGNAVAGTPVTRGTFNQHRKPPKGWWFWTRPARTDQHGRFELDPLLPFEYQVRLPQEQLLDPVTLQLAPGQADVEVELRVESASRQLKLCGRVVDERGRGVAGAKVIATERVDATEHRFPATCDRDGTFVLRRLLSSSPERPVVLTAAAPGRDDAQIDGVAWRRQDVEVVLQPLAGLTLRVVDANGIPVPSYTVRLAPVSLGSGMAWHTAGFAVHEVVAAANGEQTIGDLPRNAYDVHVSPVDPALAESAVERVDVSGSQQRHTMVLQARARRVLHLRASDGTPVAGTKIELCRPGSRAIDLHSHIVALDRWTFVHMPNKSLLVQSVSTDANGDATLDGPAATPLALRVPGPGCLPFVLPIARLDDEGPIAVDCRRGGTLRVIARPADVLTALDALRGERDEPRARAWLQRELGRVRESVPADRDNAPVFEGNGVATIDGIPDGTWVPHVALGREELVLPAVEIKGGAAREVALDLAPLRPVTIRGRVVADTPVAGRSVSIQRLHGPGEVHAGRWVDACGGYIALDDSGAFTLHSLPGRFRLLQCHRSVDGEHADLLAEPAEVEVAPAAVCEQTFTIATGIVAVRFVDREQRPVAGVAGAWVLRQGGSWRVYLPPSDNEGRTRSDRLEAGSNRLVVLPRRFGAAKTAIRKLFVDHPNEPDIVQRTQIELGPITVAPGEPGEQTIVLPDAWFR